MSFYTVTSNGAVMIKQQKTVLCIGDIRPFNNDFVNTMTQAQDQYLTIVKIAEKSLGSCCKMKTKYILS